MLGRNYCFMPVEDDEGQRIMIAQSLTFGEQLGWNDPLLYLQMKHRDFYRRCVAAREEIGSFMYEGTLLRSPEFTCDAPILRTTQCREAYGGLVEHSVIFCEHWQRFDGKRMLLLVNAGESECEARCVRSLDDGEYALAGDCSAVLKIENGNGSVKLPPLSVQYCIY